MRGLLLTFITVAALGPTVALGNASGAVQSEIASPPNWLKGAETKALDRVFGGATPIHSYCISYPRKIAVVFEFNHVVTCRTCTSAGNAPRGRVIRVSFARLSHRMNGSMQFCESRGRFPRRSLCLRR